jgi:hypothetical protein
MMDKIPGSGDADSQTSMLWEPEWNDFVNLLPAEQAHEVETHVRPCSSQQESPDDDARQPRNGSGANILPQTALNTVRSTRSGKLSAPTLAIRCECGWMSTRPTHIRPKKRRPSLPAHLGLRPDKSRRCSITKGAAIQNVRQPQPGLLAVLTGYPKITASI